jgi:hypothetical protein
MSYDSLCKPSVSLKKSRLKLSKVLYKFSKLFHYLYCKCGSSNQTPERSAKKLPREKLRRPYKFSEKETGRVNFVYIEIFAIVVVSFVLVI